MSVLYSNLLYFLLFSVIAITLYWVTRRAYRNTVLLGISLLFYTLCAGWYVGFVLFVGGWSFFCARRIDYSGETHNRKIWLTRGIVPIVVTLCFFKYWTPAWSIIGRVLSKPEGISIITIVLPLGMSYYILKSISYLIDVYKGRIRSEINPINYLAYVSFYGQIISGPIQRYEQWSREIAKEKPTKSCIDGFYIISLGLFMKLVIANRLSGFINITFANPDVANSLQLWLGFIFYAVYIYCDFAGYSYIAIGVTNCFGLDCIENFRRPYFSINIREFWNRWHISLSSWLKDYIYIPLGGNRRGAVRRALNVLITFLVCGIWHGSSLSFVIWGFYHGIANVLTSKPKNGNKGQSIRFLQSLWTFVVVAIGWVFFASSSLSSAISYFKGMFTRFSVNSDSIARAILPFTNDNTCVAFFLTVVFFIIVLILKEANDEYYLLPRNKKTSYVWQVFVLASILLFGVFGENSFIYAGF